MKIDCAHFGAREWMQLCCGQRALVDIECVLNQSEMHLADLGVFFGEISKRAIMHGHVRVIDINFGIEATLIHVVVERFQLS